MKATLTIQNLPSNLVDGETASPPSPLRSLFEALIQRLATHPSVANIIPLIIPTDYPGVPFPAASAEIPINIYLTSNRDVFAECDVDPDNTVGVFLNATDIFEGRYRPDGFHVIVHCDEYEFLRHVEQERSLEMNPTNPVHDWEYVRATLNTLTHELSHALEFIAHGHGLTPYQASCHEDGDFDEEEGLELSGFDYSNLDLVTGRWIRHDMADADMADNKRAIDVMEHRVEEKGYQLIDDCMASNQPESEALYQAFNDCLAWVQAKMEERLSLYVAPRA